MYSFAAQRPCQNLTLKSGTGSILTLIQPASAHRVPLAWLSDADLGFYTGEFARTGFRGSLNWFRNLDRNRRAHIALQFRLRHTRRLEKSWRTWR